MSCIGVLSPEKYGKKIIPFEPAGEFSASSASSIKISSPVNSLASSFLNQWVNVPLVASPASEQLSFSKSQGAYHKRSSKTAFELIDIKNLKTEKGLFNVGAGQLVVLE